MYKYLSLLIISQTAKVHNQENVLRLTFPETVAWCVSQWPTDATANLCATT